MLKIEEQFCSYAKNDLGGKSGHGAQLFRRILREALHLLPPEEKLSKEDLEINGMENLSAAVQTLMGDSVLAVTKNPTTWADLITQGPKHPLFEGWTDLPPKGNTWPHQTKTRFLWHQNSGLICATLQGFPTVRSCLTIYETRIRVFPWAKANLIPQ